MIFINLSVSKGIMVVAMTVAWLLRLCSLSLVVGFGIWPTADVRLFSAAVSLVIMPMDALHNRRL